MEVLDDENQFVVEDDKELEDQDQDQNKDENSYVWEGENEK